MFSEPVLDKATALELLRQEPVPGTVTARRLGHRAQSCMVLNLVRKLADTLDKPALGTLPHGQRTCSPDPKHADADILIAGRRTAGLVVAGPPYPTPELGVRPVDSPQIPPASRPSYRRQQTFCIALRLRNRARSPTEIEPP